MTFLDFPAWNVFPQKSPWAIFSDLLWVAESSSPTPQYPRSILLSPLTHLHRDSGKHRIIPCPPLLLLNLKNMKHACPRPVLMLFPPPAPLGTVPREAHLPSAPCSSAMGGAPMDLVEPALAGQWLDLCMDPGLAGPSPHPPPPRHLVVLAFACCCSPSSTLGCTPWSSSSSPLPLAPGTSFLVLFPSQWGAVGT